MWRTSTGWWIRLPLNEWHHSILGVNAFQSVELLAQVYDDLLLRFETKNRDGA